MTMLTPSRRPAWRRCHTHRQADPARVASCTTDAEGLCQVEVGPELTRNVSTAWRGVVAKPTLTASCSLRPNPAVPTYSR